MQTDGGDGDSYKKKNMNAFKNAECSSTTAPLAECINAGQMRREGCMNVETTG